MRPLSAQSGEFEEPYSHPGRPSISPEWLLRALLLQGFYSVHVERLLMVRRARDRRSSVNATQFTTDVGRLLEGP